MMSDFEKSISNPLSKLNVDEEMSMFHASMDDARNRLAEENSMEAISNERIQKEDVVLETYHVISDAICGGMGSVWRVRHKNWNVDIAMKRPQPRFFAEGSRERKEVFVEECENWINLGLHPNIVTCYYVREIGGIPTIFSEWMDGGSLKEYIREGTLYEGTEKEVQERILDIAIQTERGLQYSHEKKLIHQDVKPGNILMTKTWEAKVADFGLAKAQSQLSSGNKQLSTGYTLEYCPKEQAEGTPAENWMDVYAWSVTVLEMFAGKRMWETGAEVRERFGEIVSNCLFKPSAEMQEILAGCLSRDCSDFCIIEKRLTKLYAEEIGAEYPRPESKAVADVAGTLNNRALSFLDLGKTEEAERILNSEELQLDTYAICNRILYSCMGNNCHTDLVQCIRSLKELAEKLKMSPNEKGVREEILGIIEELERTRMTAPAFETYSIGFDVSGMDKIYIHPDGNLAVMHPEGKQCQLVDLREGRVVRSLKTPVDNHRNYYYKNQLQIDDSGRYILDSHIGKRTGQVMQVYHVHEEDMADEREKDGYPFLQEWYPYATFRGGRLIGYGCGLVHEDDLRYAYQGINLLDYSAYDITPILTGHTVKPEKEDALYSGSLQDNPRFHISRSGKRFMTEYYDSMRDSHDEFTINDTLTGQNIVTSPMPLRPWPAEDLGVFVIDDRDQFMLHVMDKKLYWFDLTDNCKNSYVWELDEQPRDAFVHSMPDGSRRILLHGKNNTDFVSVPIPVEKLSPIYLLHRAYSSTEIRNFGEQVTAALEEIQRLLTDEKFEEAFLKWKAAENLPTLRDHPAYNQILSKIDRLCRKKTLQSITKISQIKTFSETPRYIWKHGTQEFVLMELMESGRPPTLAGFRVQRVDGSAVGEIRIKQLDEKEFHSSWTKGAESVQRVSASPDGTMLAVQLKLYSQEIPGAQRRYATGILILRAGDSDLEVVAFHNHIKEIKDHDGVFQLLRKGLYYTNGKGRMMGISAPDYQKARTISRFFPAAAAGKAAADWRELKSGFKKEDLFRISSIGWSDDHLYAGKNGIRCAEIYKLSYEYEPPQKFEWDSDTTRILNALKPRFRKYDDAEIQDIQDIFCSLGYGCITRKEIERRL